MALTDSQKERVRELREQSIGYGQIAKQMNLTKSQVAAFCRHNGMVGFRAGATPEMNCSNFIENFNKRYGDRYEYVSGYEHCESRIIICCLECGGESEWSAQIARRNCAVKCPACKEIKRLEEKKQKEIRKKTLAEQRRIKKEQSLALKEAEKKEKEKEWKQERECPSCFSIYVPTSKQQVYCSKECAKREQNRRKEITRRHKLRENGKVDYSITLSKVIKKNKSVCAICGGIVNKKVHSNHDDYPSIDHIIPVTKGGTHTWDNVQLAHRRCNNLKRDIIPEELAGRA